jgi:hypothetical protein
MSGHRLQDAEFKQRPEIVEAVSVRKRGVEAFDVLI